MLCVVKKRIVERSKKERGEMISIKGGKCEHNLLRRGGKERGPLSTGKGGEKGDCKEYLKKGQGVSFSAIKGRKELRIIRGQRGGGYHRGKRKGGERGCKLRRELR